MNYRGEPANYYHSLNRPNLILGIDRSWFFLLMGLSLPIAFSAHLALLMDIAALLIFFLAYLISWLITRDDPQTFHLFRRHLRYHTYYSAQPDLYSKPAPPQASVPIYRLNRR